MPFVFADRRILWILLPVLGVLVAGVIFVLKFKCMKVHDHAGESVCVCVCVCVCPGLEPGERTLFLSSCFMCVCVCVCVFVCVCVVHPSGRGLGLVPYLCYEVGCVSGQLEMIGGSDNQPPSWLAKHQVSE